MELKFSIDTEEMFDEDGYSIENILTDELRRQILTKAKTEVTSDKFTEFAESVESEIVAGTKTKMISFLAEEIVLTDQWGKSKFVGSIDDLLKQRFDDILLRPVNSDGKTIEGCSTTGIKTWVEWKIENTLGSFVKSEITSAADKIERIVNVEVNNKLDEMKDSTISKRIAEVADFLKTKSV